MNLLKYIKRKLITTVTLVKYRVYFKTTCSDRIRYSDLYTYIAQEPLLCSTEEMLLSSIISEGYIEDDDGNYFILQNVEQVYFKQMEKIENVISKGEYKIFYASTEIELKGEI